MLFICVYICIYTIFVYDFIKDDDDPDSSTHFLIESNFWSPVKEVREKKQKMWIELSQYDPNGDGKISKPEFRLFFLRQALKIGDLEDDIDAQALPADITNDEDIRNVLPNKPGQKGFKIYDVLESWQKKLGKRVKTYVALFRQRHGLVQGLSDSSS